MKKKNIIQYFEIAQKQNFWAIMNYEKTDLVESIIF